MHNNQKNVVYLLLDLFVKTIFFGFKGLSIFMSNIVAGFGNYYVKIEKKIDGHKNFIFVIIMEVFYKC